MSQPSDGGNADGRRSGGRGRGRVRARGGGRGRGGEGEGGSGGDGGGGGGGRNGGRRNRSNRGGRQRIWVSSTLSAAMNLAPAASTSNVSPTSVSDTAIRAESSVRTSASEQNITSTNTHVDLKSYLDAVLGNALNAVLPNSTPETSADIPSTSQLSPLPAVAVLPNSTPGTSADIPSTSQLSPLPAVAGPSSEQQPGEPLKYYLYVKEYPKHTTKQDIVRVFSRYVPVRVEAKHNFGMLLSSDDPDAYSKIPKPMFFSATKLRVINKGSSEQYSQNRGFQLSKLSAVAPSPHSIAFIGNFYEQLATVIDLISLTPDRILETFLVYDDLEKTFRTTWPDCEVVPFGSICCGIAMKTSDADCYVHIDPDTKVPNGNPVDLVLKAESMLRRYPELYTEIIAITGANTPIVKFYHIPTGTNCDVTFKNLLGVLNSALVSAILQSHRHFSRTVLILKYWAKVHELSGTGKLSNYTLVFMFIYYVQMTTDLIPSIMHMQDCEHLIMVDGWNAEFHFPKDPPPPRNDKNIQLHDLLGGFFTFYASFDFSTYVVCPYLAEYIKKQDFAEPQDLPDRFALYKTQVIDNELRCLRFERPICVQDPFDHTHNVASAITENLCETLQGYFKFGADLYQAEKESYAASLSLPENERYDFELFLKDLLQTTVAPPKRKKNLCTSMENSSELKMFNLKAEVKWPQWHELMRRVVFHILYYMLWLDPRQTADTTSRDSRTVTWLVQVDKPLWLRRLANRRCKNSTIETDAKITRQVYNSNDNLDPPLCIKIVMNMEKSNLGKSFELLITLHKGLEQDFALMKKMLIEKCPKWVKLILQHEKTLREIRNLDIYDSPPTDEAEENWDDQPGNAAEEAEENWDDPPRNEAEEAEENWDDPPRNAAEEAEENWDDAPRNAKTMVKQETEVAGKTTTAEKSKNEPKKKSKYTRGRRGRKITKKYDVVSSQSEPNRATDEAEENWDDAPGNAAEEAEENWDDAPGNVAEPSADPIDPWGDDWDDAPRNAAELADAIAPETMVKQDAELAGKLTNDEKSKNEPKKKSKNTRGRRGKKITKKCDAPEDVVSSQSKPNRATDEAEENWDDVPGNAAEPSADPIDPWGDDWDDAPGNAAELADAIAPETMVKQDAEVARKLTTDEKSKNEPKRKSKTTRGRRGKKITKKCDAPEDVVSSQSKLNRATDEAEENWDDVPGNAADPIDPWGDDWDDAPRNAAELAKENWDDETDVAGKSTPDEKSNNQPKTKSRKGRKITKKHDAKTNAPRK